MPDEPTNETRSRGALSACLGTLPRRMVFVGALVLLGWLGVALASASSASAHTDPAAGRPATTAIGGLLKPVTPLVDRVSVVLTGPARSAVHRSSDAKAPAVARRVHAARVAPNAARVAPNAAPAPSTPAHDATTAARFAGLLDHLPLLHGLDGLFGPASNLGDVTPTSPLVDAVTAVAKPASQLTCSIAPAIAQPAAQTLQAVGVAVTSTAASISPVTSLLPIGSLLDLITMPLTGGSGGATAPAPHPGGSPPGGWSPASPAASASAPSPGDMVAALAPTFAPDNLRATDEALPVAPLTAGHAFTGSRVPAPAPAAPPTVPDIAAIATSGAAATSNPRSGTGVPSGFTSETWSAQQLQLLGIAESIRSRAVRDSATKPPVSPD